MSLVQQFHGPLPRIQHSLWSHCLMELYAFLTRYAIVGFDVAAILISMWPVLYLKPMRIDYFTSLILLVLFYGFHLIHALISRQGKSLSSSEVKMGGSTRGVAPCYTINLCCGCINDTSISPDGTKLAVVSKDGLLRVFDAHSKQLLTGCQVRIQIARNILFPVKSSSLAFKSI